MLDVVEGWTGGLDLQLKADGVAVDLSGLAASDVELILRRADGVRVGTSGNVAILSATDGVVRYSPDASDLVAARGPYLARFKVTDALGKIVFFPNGDADAWVVRSA